mgnify:CR=1 FL=1
MKTEILEQMMDPASSSAVARAKAAEIQAEAREKDLADEEALNAIISQLQARSGLVREVRALEDYASTDESAAAAAAMGELTSWLVAGATGGLQRFDRAALAWSGRVMMRPLIPAAISERRQRIAEIDSEVVATAREHGLDLRRIRAHVSRSIGRPAGELGPEQ